MSGTSSAVTESTEGGSADGNHERGGLRCAGQIDHEQIGHQAVGGVDRAGRGAQDDARRRGSLDVDRCERHSGGGGRNGSSWYRRFCRAALPERCLRAGDARYQRTREQQDQLGFCLTSSFTISQPSTHMA